MNDPSLSAGKPTRGLRVDGRCGSVNILENLLSLGSLREIFRRTLSAAQTGPGELLLDVGCGSGRLAAMAAHRSNGGLRVYGVDATPGMIDRARKHARSLHCEVEFSVAIAEDLPFPSNHFHNVASTFLFHHLPEDVKRVALREIHRVLRPGGRFVLTDYATAHGLAGRAFSFPHRFNFYEHVRSQLSGELERAIPEAGFARAEVVCRFLGYITIFRARKLPVSQVF